jgi:hypothetical protein
MKVVSPCKDCPNRYPACHDACEQFAEYKRDRYNERSSLYKYKHCTFKVLKSQTNLRKYSALGRSLA